MTLKGKIFAALFFATIIFSGGIFTGYKLFNKPQTINEFDVNVKKLKGNENSNLNIEVKPEVKTDNSSRREKKKNRVSNN